MSFDGRVAESSRLPHKGFFLVRQLTIKKLRNIGTTNPGFSNKHTKYASFTKRCSRLKFGNERKLSNNAEKGVVHAFVRLLVMLRVCVMACAALRLPSASLFPAGLDGRNIESGSTWQGTTICVNNARVLSMAINVIYWSKMAMMEVTYLTMRPFSKENYSRRATHALLPGKCLKSGNFARTKQELQNFLRN
jgi:hypothetical protein